VIQDQRMQMEATEANEPTPAKQPILAPAARPDPAPKPMLLRLRSGKTAALVIALGFGGGTIIMGVGSTAASAARGNALLGALVGYGIAVLPLLALAAIIAVCKSELWLFPETRSLRLLTYRPWRLGPRIEEAPLSEYAGVRTSAMTDDYGRGTLVSLVTTAGEDVPLRQFKDDAEAGAYAEKLGEAAGLWVRRATESKPAEA
jgi:hypothetical protein